MEKTKEEMKAKRRKHRKTFYIKGTHIPAYTKLVYDKK